MKSISQIVILCGGYGKRLKKISKKQPKALIKIKKKPFLYWVLKNLEKKGLKKVVLCTGYKSKEIEEFISKNRKKFKFSIDISSENPKKLLGTGGAVKKIYKKLENYFYLMYGDTFLHLNLGKIVKAYKNSNKPILMTIIKNFDKRHKNNISLKKQHLIYDKNSKEKMEYLDYGIMIFKKKIFKTVNKKSFDLSELLKSQSIKKNISYYIKRKTFFEIGDPKGYKNTIKNFKRIYHEIYK